MTSASSTARRLFASETNEVTFYWHGGEPFAQPISYWRAILEEQRAEFAGTEESIHILNAVQSNLTLIRAEHLPLLEQFRLGFSFDVFNSLRVNAGGKSTDERVRKAISWLSEAGVPLAGIVVVTPANLNYAAEVADFFINRWMPFRFIHLDEGLEHLPQVWALRIPFAKYLDFAECMYRTLRVQFASPAQEFNVVLRTNLVRFTRRRTLVSSYLLHRASGRLC